jgi:hypothetical protein
VADAPVVHIGENSPEQVAYKLMRLVAEVEGREHYGHGPHPMTREWILKTFDQCLSVVRGSGASHALESYAPESFAKPAR